MSRQTIAYQPALDGTRALAVTAVLLYHGGFGWMSGGYLGVSVFFTLSGYLITSLLLAEHHKTGSVNAAAFYTRRARRLLPASVVCLLGISIMSGAGWFRGAANVRRDVIGALLQVFNWVQLLGGGGYGGFTAESRGIKSPVEHYWSLAIEEQFYWIWPLAFLGLMALGRRWGKRPVFIVGWLTAIAAVTAPLIAHLWSSDAAYLSTPARMCEILAGALAACWLHNREVSQRLAPLAPVSLAVLAVACVLFPDGHGPAYQGAMPLVAAVSAALIIGLQAQGPVRQLVGTIPLVALGKISYGVYLYHWPIFWLVDREYWDLPHVVLFAIKCGITLAVALVSYYLIERPVRTANWLPPARTLVGALTISAVAFAAAFVVIPSEAKYYGVDDKTADAAAIDTGSVAPLVPLTTTTSTTMVDSTVPGTDLLTTTLPLITTTTGLPVPPRPVRIVVIGDSTAEATGAGLVAWAAAHPDYAQVEVDAGPGCGLSLGGYLVFADSERNVDKQCGPYVKGIIRDKVAAAKPDVVMLLTTTWDVADRRLEKGGPVLPSNDPAVADLIKFSFQSLTDELLGLGVSRVVWVKEPIPVVGMLGPDDRQRDAARHQSLYAIMDSIAAANPTAVRTADLAGWVDEVGWTNDLNARKDAVHWTPEAALRMADEFLAPALITAALT